MTLWMILFAIASVTPAVAGFVEGGKAGVVGNVVGFLLGLAIGTGWLLGLLTLKRILMRSLAVGRSSAFWKHLEVSLFYIAVIMSNFASAFVAIYITRFITHYVPT
jgi:hypothetical protein